MSRLKELRFRLTRRWARRGTPHGAYVASGARFVRVNKDLRFILPVVSVDLLDAARRNYEIIRDAASRAGIETFVVNAAPADGTVVGMPHTDTAAFLAELGRVSEQTPLYMRARSVAGRRWAGLAYQKLGGGLHDLESMELYCHYREPSTSQNFGARYACRVEFWQEDVDGTLHAPTLNGRAARIDRGDRAERIAVDVHGAEGMTMPPLAAPTVLEVGFPIDAVYMWVDGQDPEWQARRAARLAAMTGEPPVADSLRAVRFDQGDELRFSLRSAHRYAPWIRRIFVVTDGQRPPWLVEEPGRLDIIDHRDILPAEHLPTFNSHAITSALHHIQGLAEHFIVMNDDVLFGRPVAPDAFFLSNGVSRFFPSRSALPSGPPTDDDPPLVLARKHSQRLIEEATGLRPNFGFKHTPIAFQKALLAELEETVPAWSGTLASPFRAATDIVPEWLHHWLGYASRKCLPSAIDYAYFDIGSEQAIRRLRGTIFRSRRPAVLCVNDVTEGPTLGANRHETLNAVLQEFYPRPSPWEGTDRVAPGVAAAAASGL